MSDSQQDIAGLLAQVEQAAQRAREVAGRHADADCGCMFCEALRDAAENLVGVQGMLETALEDDRLQIKADALPGWDDPADDETEGQQYRIG